MSEDTVADLGVDQLKADMEQGKKPAMINLAMVLSTSDAWDEAYKAFTVEMIDVGLVTEKELLCRFIRHWVPEHLTKELSDAFHDAGRISIEGVDEATVDRLVFLILDLINSKIIQVGIEMKRILLEPSGKKMVAVVSELCFPDKIQMTLNERNIFLRWCSFINSSADGMDASTAFQIAMEETTEHLDLTRAQTILTELEFNYFLSKKENDRHHYILGARSLFELDYIFDARHAIYECVLCGKAIVKQIKKGSFNNPSALAIEEHEHCTMKPEPEEIPISADEKDKITMLPKTQYIVQNPPATKLREVLVGNAQRPIDKAWLLDEEQRLFNKVLAVTDNDFSGGMLTVALRKPGDKLPLEAMYSDDEIDHDEEAEDGEYEDSSADEKEGEEKKEKNEGLEEEKAEESTMGGNASAPSDDAFYFDFSQPYVHIKCSNRYVSTDEEDASEDVQV